jgi:SAM-dependent methyltransferase
MPGSRVQRRRRSPLAGASLAASAVAVAGASHWLNRRARRLAVLDDRPGRQPPDLPDDGYTLVTAAGVAVDAATQAAAVRHARAHDLDVLDLVPGDLPSGALQALLLQIDPARYPDDRLAVGRGAGHAAVVRTAVLDRAAAAHPPPGDGWRDLDPVTALEVARRLKRYAPTATDLAVAPGLRSVPVATGWRLPHLRALAGVAAPVLAPMPATGAVLALLAPLVHPVAGGAALAAYLAQPALVARGAPVRPCDIGVGDLLRRPFRAVVAAVRPLATAPPPGVVARADKSGADERARRRVYAADASRRASFFEPRRDTCPWCAAGDLAPQVTVPDLFQGKAGTFHLDRCRACAHVFQNPRLSLAGLDHYYRDFYDGLAQEHTETMFTLAGASYRGRAGMLRGVAEPKRWLDVGTGNGYFCLVAQEVWPETRFDGLDLTPNVVEAERRGWVERGFHGLFPDLADELTGRYDVVSMHHYLEHTRDPAAELDAAAAVLEDGGHLLVEVPAPESALARRLGWLWGPWLQPQHQHFVPEANLVAALKRRGFRVLAAERGEVHQPVDLGYAVMLLANLLAPAAASPWNPPPTVGRRLGRAATYAALLPLAGIAVAADQALVPVVRRRPQLSNAYRVLARKE